MTVTANGKRPTFTDGEVSGGVHVRVRAAENPGSASDPAGPIPRSTRAYAISRLVRIRQLVDARSFVSLSVTDAASAVASGWLPKEQLPPLLWSWRHVVPAKGEATGPLSWAGLSAAGLVRASVHSLAYLFAFATATRRRAAVFGVLCLLLAIVYVAGHLAG